MIPDASRIAEKLNDLVMQRDAALWRLDFEYLSPPDRVFLAFWELHSEVYNGGLWQFFLNSSGELTPFVGEALSAIDGSEAASIFDEAVAVLGPDVSWGDGEARCAVIQSLPQEALDRLDELGSPLSDHLDALMVPLFRYLSKHRNEVEIPAEFWTEADIQ